MFLCCFRPVCRYQDTRHPGECRCHGAEEFLQRHGTTDYTQSPRRTPGSSRWVPLTDSPCLSVCLSVSLCRSGSLLGDHLQHLNYCTSAKKCPSIIVIYTECISTWIQSHNCTKLKIFSSITNFAFFFFLKGWGGGVLKLQKFHHLYKMFGDESGA